MNPASEDAALQKSHLNPINGAPKTAPTTPLGASENLRKAHLNRTSSSNLVTARSRACFPQRSASQKLIGDKRPHFAAGKRSASPQPRIITSTVSMVEAEHEAASATKMSNSTSPKGMLTMIITLASSCDKALFGAIGAPFYTHGTVFGASRADKKTLAMQMIRAFNTPTLSLLLCL